MERQAEFFEREADRLGRAPPVVDASDILADPEAVLKPLCAALGIPWDPAMLHWPAGRRDDGRTLGAALVSGGRSVDRLRPARSAARESARRGAARGRAVLALLSQAGRAPDRSGAMTRMLLLLALFVATPSAAQTVTPAQYREDAESIEGLISRVYAYPERLPGGRFILTPKLREEAAQVGDSRSLLRFAERAIILLADHHAITGSSFRDSYGLVPSFADLWIVQTESGFMIDAVRDGSPAASAGIRAGDRLVAIDGVPVAQAVAAFWADLGASPAERDAAFAARVLAAGRRDRPRRLSVQTGGAPPRVLDLANLYTVQSARLPPVTVGQANGAFRLRINDSLGDDATVAAFDAAMARARPGQTVIVDLTTTPGGGNSSVARGILGWFVDRPRFFQMHNLPAEERETGIGRQWVEQVLPRPGKHHRGPVRVEVGRWTGSMGEGLAIGFDAIGVPVFGTRMAGLLGAVYDQRLPHSGLLLKLPAERLKSCERHPPRGFRAAPAAAPALKRRSAPLHKSRVLTHIGVAVIGRLARGLVVADKPDASRMGVFELNTAACGSKGLGGR